MPEHIYRSLLSPRVPSLRAKEGLKETGGFPCLGLLWFWLFQSKIRAESGHFQARPDSWVSRAFTALSPSGAAGWSGGSDPSIFQPCTSHTRLAHDSQLCLRGVCPAASLGSPSLHHPGISPASGQPRASPFITSQDSSSGFESLAHRTSPTEPAHTQAGTNPQNFHSNTAAHFPMPRSY